MTTPSMLVKFYGEVRRPTDPTDRQLDYAFSLAGERLIPSLGTCGEERMENIAADWENNHPDRYAVSRQISFMKEQPIDTDKLSVGVHNYIANGGGHTDAGDVQELVGPGVYELDGSVYIIAPSKRTAGRRYAKKLLVSTDSQGEFVLKFDYAHGVIYKLTEAHRMDIDVAKELCRKFGRCICCTHKLRVEKSLDRAIGPVCIKLFR